MVSIYSDDSDELYDNNEENNEGNDNEEVVLQDRSSNQFQTEEDDNQGDDNEGDDNEEEEDDDNQGGNDNEKGGNEEINIRQKEKTSNVWDFVDKESRKCSCCGKIFNKNTGTSSIHSHLKGYGILLNKKKQTTLDSFV
ncbi:unnamed protein product [Rhizophagus irregularis]|nr:unnamed protein product [Rhizophagus irregularis]CAB5364351.1 unnamed protein product [Rhizophagus irregularis]